jgi:hypothetical protein
VTDPFDDPDRLLLKAVHRGCGRTVATYWRAAGWSTLGSNCRCQPPPTLPSDAAVRRELACGRKRVKV